jgi:two-component SAPR family response regulator
MHGTILIYGNDELLVLTRCLILERAGNHVFTAQSLPNAMLALMNHEIDILILCQSLSPEERRSISETAKALPREIQRVYFGPSSELLVEGTDICQHLDSPQSFLKSIERILNQKEFVQSQPLQQLTL